MVETFLRHIIPKKAMSITANVVLSGYGKSGVKDMFLLGGGMNEFV